MNIVVIKLIYGTTNACVLMSRCNNDGDGVPDESDMYDAIIHSRINPWWNIHLMQEAEQIVWELFVLSSDWKNTNMESRTYLSYK